MTDLSATEKNSINRVVLQYIITVVSKDFSMNDQLPKIGPHGFITQEDESIYYESYGTGETVILCHGLGGNHAIWYQQVPVLACLFNVITWDQRGFGRSTNRAKQSGPAAAVIDLKSLIDHLKVEQAHIIGQSMGGMGAEASVHFTVSEFHVELIQNL